MSKKPLTKENAPGLLYAVTGASLPRLIVNVFWIIIRKVEQLRILVDRNVFAASRADHPIGDESLHLASPLTNVVTLLHFRNSFGQLNDHGRPNPRPIAEPLPVAV